MLNNLIFILPKTVKHIEIKKQSRYGYCHSDHENDVVIMGYDWKEQKQAQAKIKE
jgi:hypothetical protein